MAITIKSSSQKNISIVKSNKVVITKGVNKIIKLSKRGSQGPAGVGADQLEPRIIALEEATDGLVSGADPLSYYILAKNT